MQYQLALVTTLCKKKEARKQDYALAFDTTIKQKPQAVKSLGEQSCEIKGGSREMDGTMLMLISASLRNDNWQKNHSIFMIQ